MTRRVTIPAMTGERRRQWRADIGWALLGAAITTVVVAIIWAIVVWQGSDGAPPKRLTADPAPRSQLADITLPTGSKPASGSPAPGIEVWNVPLPVDRTKTAIRLQLPVEKPYRGLPWCDEDENGRLQTVTWSWGETEADMLVVSVMPDDSGSRVIVVRSGMPGGCY